MEKFLGAVSTDIIEEIALLKVQIEKLKLENNQLHKVINHLPGSIYWKNCDGVYLGCNKTSQNKMKEMGYNSGVEDIVGKTDFELFSPDIAKVYRNHDLKVMQDKITISTEEEYKTAAGLVGTQLSTKAPLYAQNGDLIGIIGNTVDITYLKKIEKELIEAKNIAERADKLKTEFIRNMEHDIRTPFSGIWAMTDYLYHLEMDEEKKDILKDILDSSKELMDYCDSILDFSRIEAGYFIVEKKVFSLKELLETVEKIQFPAVRSKGLYLQSEISSDIPDAIMSDPYRIQRILINLVSNAIKFTPHGGITIKANIAQVHANEPAIQIDVIDTGIGISEEQQKIIFDTFVRLNPSNQGIYCGPGLGLRVVKQFINELEGEIRVNSKPDQGTHISLLFPFSLP